MNLLPAAAVQKAIEEFLDGVEVESLSLRYNRLSSWYGFDVWVHFKGEYRFAVWINTAAIYEVGTDGAVGDDPITTFPKHDAWQYRPAPGLL